MDQINPINDDSPDRDWDAADYVLNEQRQARITALTSLDADPEEAAKAVDLSKATGAPAPLVLGDMENFQQQHKAALTAELLRNNRFLEQYAADPIAAQVSNDDWGSLDKISQHLDHFHGPLPQFGKEIAKGIGSGDTSAIKRGFEAFKEAHGDWIGIDRETMDRITSNPVVANILNQALGPLWEAGMRLPLAALTGIAAAAGQAYANLTGSKDEGIKLARELIIVPQVAFPEMAGAHVPPELNAIARQAKEAITVAHPWAEAGIRPPNDLHPLLAQGAAEEAKIDQKNFDELFKETQANATRERSPPSFEKFTELHTGDDTIGISVEKVKELYGDKLPEPDDNKLGFIPNIREQYESALASGGDIEAPWKMVLAHTTPETMEVLHDGLRLRPGGMTLDEVAGVKPVELKGEGEEYRPYKNVPDQLMGFKKEGPQKGYEETKYSHEQPVLVTSPDMAPFQDQIKGLNKEHALERARRNWEGAKIEAIEGPVEALRRASGLDPLAARDFKQEPGPTEPSIIPSSAKPYEGGVVTTKQGTEFSPYLNFPLKDALKNLDIKTEGIPGELQKKFAERLSKIVGNVPVRIVKDEDMKRISPDYFGKSRTGENYSLAFYNPKTDEIYMSDRLAQGRSKVPGFAPYALIHEGSHALSIMAMRENPGLRSKVVKFMNEVKETLSETDPDILKEPGHQYALFKNEYEFWAQAQSDTNFQHTLSLTAASDDLREAVGLKPPEGKSLMDVFRRLLKNMLQKMLPDMQIPDTMVDVMLHLQEEFEKHEVKARGIDEGVLAAKSEGETPIFKTGSALGMTKDRLEGYLKLIAQQNEEKAKFARDQEQVEAGKRATQEWKDNYDRVREETQDNINRRPDFAIDRALRTGEMPNGEKIQKFKLDPAAIDPELRKRIPPEYLGAGGVHPDALADKFGYQSGEQLVKSLARLNDEREMAGLTPAGYLKSVTDAEAERRMQELHGRSAQDIIDEAKEHILSPTSLDILHAEWKALAEGKADKISLADVKNYAKELMNKVPMAAHSSDKYLAEAGRADKKAIIALEEGDRTEALKAAQERMMASLKAKEALKLEKLRASFDSKVKNWQKREPSGVPQEDAVWIHQILLQIGQGVRRSVQDLDQQKALVSPYMNLREYVEGTNKFGEIFNQDVDAIQPAQQLNVAEQLFSDNYRTTMNEMTPQEFREIFDSLKSIDHYGRDSKKVTVKGNKEDLNDVVSGLIARLKAAVNNQPITDAVQQKRSAGRLVGTWLLNPETWMNRLDLGNRLGPFNQLIIRPIVEGQYQLRTYLRDFAKQWKDLGDFPDLGKKIENPLFRDPQSGDLIRMTKENAYAVLQNMGNELQRRKMVLGWKIDKDVEQGTQKIWQWLRSVGINADDLARAQKLGGIFSNAFALSEKAYTHVAGVAPERIELKTVQTPWGAAKEWYHPLIPDPLRHSSKLTIDQMMGDSGYWRQPSPASGYTKSRTGVLYPVDLTFDSVPFKLKQILNDAAMRIPINEVGKIVNHNDFKGAFKKYYGQEYASALDGWMHDVAGNRQWVPSNLKALDSAVNTIQQNLSTLLIGWNLGTVGKHAPTAAVFSAAEVGPLRFANSLMKMIYQLPGSREAWGFVMENSEEVRNRMRTLEDTLIAQNREMFKKLGWKGKLGTFRDTVEWYGHAPVAFTDLISAVSMWHAEYLRLAEEKPDLSHGDLVYAADTAVRRTHGSSIVSNRPGIMRYNSPFAKMIVPFYNFLSNALQRNYELAWKSKLAMQGRELPEMTGFEKEQFEAGPQHIKSIIGGVMVYGVMVSLIEQMIDPLPDKKENRAVHWAKILTRGYPSMIPGVRDAVNYLYQGHDPSVGLYGTFARNVDKAIDPKSYQHDPGRTLRTLNTLFGTLTGLTFEPLGRAGQFIVNVATGREHPKGMGDLFKGLYRGTMKEPKQ